MTEREGVEACGLPPEAYEEIPGEDYPPYVSASDSPPEITFRSILLGALFGILFGAANAYLGLRVGLTISTSIPVAVLTVVAFTLWRDQGARGTRILEANMSQTIGSASSSVASGIIFTLPALFLWGVVPSLVKMTTVALAGGLLGVLFMVPLRRFLMRGEHGRLPYPEGTACAEVLVASEVGGAKARGVFYGIGAGALYRLFQGALKLWRGDVSVGVPLLPKAELGLETSPALLGVGYILGPRIAAVMVGGGLLAWLVIIPSIAWLGQDWTAPLYPETEQLVRDMAPARLWTRYVRYVGAGAVAMGGLITLVRAFPMMVQSFRVGWDQIRRRVSEGAEEVLRTDRDLSLSVVLGGVAAVVAFLAMAPHVLGFLETPVLRIVAALSVAIFAFFFVTVSSRIVGLVGVTSNPTSGMTIATLLGTSGLFLAFGWTDLGGQAAALTVGAVVAVAASIAGDTSQDLKTGFLLGATPRRQQLGEIFGVLTSAFFVCLTVSVLAEAYGFGTRELPAPQATLMKLVIEGVLARDLPWLLVGIGAAIALVAELVGLPSLAFAVGILSSGVDDDPSVPRWAPSLPSRETSAKRRRGHGAPGERRSLRIGARRRRGPPGRRHRRFCRRHDAGARGLRKRLGGSVGALVPALAFRRSRVDALAFRSRPIAEQGHSTTLCPTLHRNADDQGELETRVPRFQLAGASVRG